MSTTKKPMMSILERWRGREIATVRTRSQAWAVHSLVRSGVSLKNADLREFAIGSAFLRGADLRGADLARAQLEGVDLRDASLRGANLQQADLVGANLQQADLRGANLAGSDLSRSDLRGARLVGAELRSACLDGALLDGALLDWKRGTVPAEILRRSAGEPDGHPRLVLDLLIHGDRDDVPWLALLGRHQAAVRWAAGRLALFVRPGDNAPLFLKRIAAARRRRATAADVLSILSWTRREGAC